MSIARHPENRSIQPGGGYPAPALRRILETGDPGALAAALRSGRFSDELCASMLREMPDLPFRLRILLAHPELADVVPETAQSDGAGASLPDADSSEAAPSALEAQLARWQFEAGIRYPQLREIILGMRRAADPDMASFGTDGLTFYYAPSDADARITYADLQHMLMHCIFRHMVTPKNVLEQIWDLACDMSAEYLRAEFFGGPDAASVRFAVLDALPSGTDPRDAEAVYEALMDLFEDELGLLTPQFTRDDHRYWHRRPGAELLRAGLLSGAGKASGAGVNGGTDVLHVTADICGKERPENDPARRAGADASEDGGGSGSGGEDAVTEILQMTAEEWNLYLAELLEERWMLFWTCLENVPSENRIPSRSYGIMPGSREEKALLREAGKYDFTRYLRRFAVLREEVQLDMTGFDYIPYYYGLQRYGNMPMLEPLEYTESYRIEELVIAIDTSGSCTRPVVERFLGEIERILMRRENFFRKMCIHIIQCDSVIQDDTEIRSQEDWQIYRRDLTIKGRGGTSFIPVFEQVAALQAKGELKHLKGLLYFTDGDGVYPREKPPYETAFVFTDRKALEYNIPEWIVPLCLDM